jgi:hypothetical protein
MDTEQEHNKTPIVGQKKNSPGKWWGLVALIIFGLFIAEDFSAVHPTVEAAGIGIVIAIIFVGVVKLTGIEPGWPKD